MQPSRIERVTEVIEYSSNSPSGPVERYSTIDAQREPVRRSFRETRNGYSRSPIKAADPAEYGSKERTYVIGYGSPLNINKRYENEVIHRSTTKESRTYDDNASVHSNTQNSAKRFEGTYSKSPIRKDTVESGIRHTQYSGRREPERDAQPKVRRYYEEVIERKVPVDQRPDVDAESFEHREYHHPLKIEGDSDYKVKAGQPASRAQQVHELQPRYNHEREPEEVEPARNAYTPARREELTHTIQETRVSGRRTPTKESASKTPAYQLNDHQEARRPATPDRHLVARNAPDRPASNLGATRTVTERISPNGRTIEERVVGYDHLPPREIEDELNKVRSRIEEIKRRTQELEDARGHLSETEQRLEETYKRATQLPIDVQYQAAEKPIERLGKTEVFYEGDTRVERTIYPSPKKEATYAQPTGVDRFPARSHQFDSPLAQKSPVADRYSATKGGLSDHYSNSKPKKIVETTIYYED